MADQPTAAQYLRRVRRIAPGDLVGRADEWSALTAFCTSEESPPCLWWEGAPWAGKSALMAWFVTHPPRGVQPVAFFVTSRVADQSTRAAFLVATIAQLSALLNEPVPALALGFKDLIFQELLARAAASGRQNQQRLVLVLDGWDEESSADRHRIAYGGAGLPGRTSAAGTRHRRPERAPPPG